MTRRYLMGGKPVDIVGVVRRGGYVLSGCRPVQRTFPALPSCPVNIRNARYAEDLRLR